jgi:Transposase IS66 family
MDGRSSALKGWSSRVTGVSAASKTLRRVPADSMVSGILRVRTQLNPLTRFLDDGQLPIDNNWIENQIPPIAIGRQLAVFAGSLRAGQGAAAVMSLIQSARLSGHDPYAYTKNVLSRPPTQLPARSASYCRTAGNPH